MKPWFACWKQHGQVKCTDVCFPFDVAEKVIEGKRKQGFETTLQECRYIPKIFYGHSLALVNARETFEMFKR